MVVLGVDPSVSRPAYSKLKTDKNGRVIKILGYGKPFKTVLSYWMQLAVGVDYVFLEDQYLGVNYASSKKLTFSAGEISAAFKLADAKVVLVPPSAWQSIMLSIEKHTKREERKRISKIVASDIVKERITDPDVADAICISYYGAKKLMGV